MKKIGLYLGICALGLTLGCSNSDKTKGEIKDNPTSVSIENVYVYRYEGGKPTCLYSPKGRNIGGCENPKDGEIALRFEIKVHDKDIINNIHMGWNKYEGEDVSPPFFSYEKKSKNKKTKFLRLDNGHPENYLKNIPFKVKVVDWKGNTTETEFTLDQILENAKPMKTKPMKLIDGDLECEQTY